jgi:hypothetical protein
LNTIEESREKDGEKGERRGKVEEIGERLRNNKTSMGSRLTSFFKDLRNPPMAA